MRESIGQMKVLYAVSEAVPFVKTGGLADVGGALYKSLRSLGVDCRLIMPLYRCMKKGFGLEDTGVTISVAIAGRHISAQLYKHEDDAIFIECDEMFDIDDIYGSAIGNPDEVALRFIFFSRAVLEAARALDFIPDIINCNDWHTGLIPLYLKSLYAEHFRHTRTVLSIHNLGYQGIFPPHILASAGIGPEYFHPEGIEFFGQVNFLKAGIIYADRVTTVSEKYAEEIMTPEFGHRLEGVIRKRAADLHGIVNGIDSVEWNPATDEALVAGYSAKTPGGKKKCRSALAADCGFTDKSRPILIIVSRLSSQKGIDIFLDSAREIMALGINMAILGSGEGLLVKGLNAFASANSDSVSVRIGYDECLARQMYAGADMIVIPSRYEPCGLTQMIAMRYGTVPIARDTGGLSDTIHDYHPLEGTGTGFLFPGSDRESLTGCVKRALCVYANGPKWKRLVADCMAQDFTWEASAIEYLKLYRSVVKAEG